MKTNFLSTDCERPTQYALTRGPGVWHLTFEGRQASFKHELGALYVACLLLEPPPEPMHAVALALKVRNFRGQHASADEARADTLLGLDQAEAVQALWRRQRELERVLEDRLQIEPVKAEALRELEEVLDTLRQSPWRPWQCAERCARAVNQAIRRFHANLVAARDAAGHPDPVLRAFARHLKEHLLIPSRRGIEPGGPRTALPPAGFFTYEPPKGVVWEISLKAEGQRLKDCGTRIADPPAPDFGAARCGMPTSGVTSHVSRVTSHVSRVTYHVPRVASQVSLVTLFAVGLALLVAGCTGPRPLRGGEAVTTHKTGGVLEQALRQGENPAQASRQEQTMVRVRTYTLPAGAALVSGPESQASGPKSQVSGEDGAFRNPQSAFCNGLDSQLSTLNSQLLVSEREESHTRTELGAAQKDMARELGARLASLKGIVWVGVGLFVFGLASLVWPPLKALVASVTTSAGCLLGGVALMVLPSLIAGHELLLLGIVGLAVGAWFLAHRHGQLRGEVSSLKSQA